MMMREIDEIVIRGELNETSLVCLNNMIDILKDVGEIEAKEQGYSQRGYSMYPYAWDGNSYNGYSGRQRRDSMGRFTSNSYDGMSNRSDHSRGSEREEIMAKMGHMLDTASSETERQAIQRVMNSL